MNLLLAAAILLQDKSAQDAFNKIEESLLKAKSFVVFSKGEATFIKNGQMEKLEINGLLSLKEGNKSNAKTTRTSSIKGVQGSEIVSLVCDGKKLSVRAGGTEFDKSQDLDAPNNHNDRQIKRFARLGLGIASVLMCQVQEETAYDVEDLRMTESQEDGTSLIYKLKSSPGISEVKVWFDPKSYRILRRIIRLNSRTTQGLLSETYEPYTLNADIPDEKFKLPEEKK